MLALLAVLARLIADPGIDDDGVADFELVVGNAAQISDGIDDARPVPAEHPGCGGHRETGQTADDEEIQVIQRGGADADADLAALGVGLL